MPPNILIIVLATLSIVSIVIGTLLIRHHRSQQAYAANFLYSLTHGNLSNPVQSALAAADNLNRQLDQIASTDVEPLKITARDLTHALNKLSETSHNLRRLALLEVGEYTAISERFNLVAIVQKLIMEVGPEADNASVALLFEGESQAVHLVQPQEYVNNILVNLLQNAIKYSADSTDACVVVSITAKEDSATVVISDNGRGMNTTQLDSLTTKPHRPNAQNFATSGSGLGLYLVKRLVDECQGSLELQSEVGVGTIATVKLPLMTGV